MSFVCIHAHFYQPSREDPWTGVWPAEPTARPWRNWNERITDECYAPNAAARLLDDRGRRRGVIDTYARIGFDVGPTLLQWLEVNRPVVHAAMVRADREARAGRDGRGTALAQGHHHAILPLCDEADRRTEIAWGLRDFELRFGRRAEGLWLPECAVDVPTLAEAAAQGVSFVVLAPHQLGRVRPRDTDRWLEPAEVPDLVRRAYVVHLPGDRRISVIPYDGGLAHGIAFGGWLNDGEGLGRRLVELAREMPDGLVHVATDGESYGHHHRHGEMALARALEIVEADPHVELVGHATYLERVPPTWEAELAEGTSWSCAHGLERWRSDCGCSTGEHPTWHQRWRGPLREALDALRDDVRAAIAPEAARAFRDPAAARDAYVDLLRDHADETFHAWFALHGARPHLTPPQIRRAHALLEIERHLLAMYTSCGWFFDDVTGIEARQDVRHAACALGLLEEELGIDLHDAFVARLAALPANRDPRELVDLVVHARRHGRPVRAPHAPASLTAMAEEGPVDPPVRPEVSHRMHRAAGLLLHVTSLPGPGPIGDLDAALDAIDWMVDAGVTVWQVLPLAPPDGTGSPYASTSALSAWAGLAGLGPLVAAGLLSRDEARPPEGPMGRVDLDLVTSWKLPLLRTAALRLRARPEHPLHDELAAFLVANPWAFEAARYEAAKEAHGGAPWWTWPDALRRRTAPALDALDRDGAEAIFVSVATALFVERQWQRVRTYATARGVRLLGDLPIYVGHDSAEVWADPDLFQLDAEGLPTAVAGVPPDAFSITGQRWGNPLYAWDRHEADGFRWWIRRLRRALALTDHVRLDHFVGFVTAWSIPAGAPDARAGRWTDGPGRRLFDALEAELGDLPLVLEDLGEVSPPVRALQRALGYPGMRVLQFGFGADGAPEHLPENLPIATVAYVGTHDNDTAIGWWNALTPADRAATRAAFRDPGGDPARELTALLVHARAIWAVITAQDVLGLGAEARLNTPGTARGNWCWRLRPGTLDEAAAARLRGLVAETGRLPPVPPLP